jgi:antitoxin CptB
MLAGKRHDRYFEQTARYPPQAAQDPQLAQGNPEMDLLLGRFVDAELADLSDGELDLFEKLLFEDDQDLYAWITGERPWPTSLNNPLTARLTAFTARWKPTD